MTCNEIYQYTPDMTRPLCPECGEPVQQDTDTPEIEWEGTCSGGHTFTFQLDDSETMDYFNFPGEWPEEVTRIVEKYSGIEGDLEGLPYDLRPEGNTVIQH